MWWMTWGALVHIVMNAVASTGIFVLDDDDAAGTDAADPSLIFHVIFCAFRSCM